jgi:hypothetical protein
VLMSTAEPLGDRKTTAHASEDTRAAAQTLGSSGMDY